MKIVKVTELQKQLAVIAGVAVVLFALGITLVIIPGVQKTTQLQKDISEIGRKHELLTEAQAAEIKITEAESWLMNKKEKNLFLSRLTSLVKKYHIELQSANPDPSSDSDKKSYRPLTVRVAAQCQFKGLLGFISEMGTTKPRIAVDELSLVQVTDRNQNGKKRRYLTVTFVLRTLLVSPSESTQPVRAN